MSQLFYGPAGRPPVRPEHDVRRMGGFETLHQARERWQRDVALTRDIGHLRFRRCRQAQPCNSAACRLCMREFRVWLVSQGIEAFEHGGRMTAVSLVHADWRRDPGTLHTLDLEKLKRQARRHIERTGLRIAAIGGIDVSFNEHSDAAWNPHWQGHLYLIVQGAKPGDVKKALARFYPVIDSIPRPVQHRIVETPVGAFSYAIKSAIFRRVSYVAKAGRGNTNDCPLKPEQQRELLVFFDQHEPIDRLFLRNVRRRGARLVVVKPVSK